MNETTHKHQAQEDKIQMDVLHDDKHDNEWGIEEYREDIIEPDERCAALCAFGKQIPGGM
jgi:hypothetical protein